MATQTVTVLSPLPAYLDETDAPLELMAGLPKTRIIRGM